MDGGPPVVRRAEVADVPGIQGVARQTWPVTYAGIIPPELQGRLLDAWYGAAALEQAIVDEGSLFLVAERGGAVVGFAQYAARSGDSADLTRLYVLPAWQRAGAGTRLLEAGLRDLRARGVKTLTVLVERDNAPGRRFYRSRGFAEVGERTVVVLGHALHHVECRRAVAGDAPQAG